MNDCLSVLYICAVGLNAFSDIGTPTPGETFRRATMSHNSPLRAHGLRTAMTNLYIFIHNILSWPYFKLYIILLNFIILVSCIYFQGVSSSTDPITRGSNEANASAVALPRG